MSKEKLEELMSDYLDGQLDPQQCAHVESALDSDPQAAEILRQLQVIQTGLHSFGDEERELGPEFTARVIQALTDTQVELKPKAIQKFNRRKGLLVAAVAASVVLLVTFWPGEPDPSHSDGSSVVSQDDPTGSELVVGSPTPQQTHDPRVTPDVPESEVRPPDSNPDQVVGVDSESKPGAVPETPNNSMVRPGDGPRLQELEQMVGMESFSKGKFLFVIEIGVTPEGIRSNVIKDILMKNGIIYDEGLEVAAELEQELLDTRYLDGVIKKPDPDKPQDIGGSVDLIYLVCTGMQVDQARLDIHSRHKDIAKYRFNLAMLPKDVKTFDLLHDAVNSQWATASPSSSKQTDREQYQARLKQWQGKAGRLMTSFVFLMNPRAATSAIEFDFKKPIPRPEGVARGNLSPPAPTNKPILGADLICEVLLVVRNMSQQPMDGGP